MKLDELFDPWVYKESGKPRTEDGIRFIFIQSSMLHPPSSINLLSHPRLPPKDLLEETRLLARLLHRLLAIRFLLNALIARRSVFARRELRFLRNDDLVPRLQFFVHAERERHVAHLFLYG